MGVRQPTFSWHRFKALKGLAANVTAQNNKPPPSEAFFLPQISCPATAAAVALLLASHLHTGLRIKMPLKFEEEKKKVLYGKRGFPSLTGISYFTYKHKPWCVSQPIINHSMVFVISFPFI